MSRIQYTISESDGLEKLHKAVINTLNQLLKAAVKTANLSAQKGSATPVLGVEAAGSETPQEQRGQHNNRRHSRNRLRGQYHHAPPAAQPAAHASGTRAVCAHHPQGGRHESARVGLEYQSSANVHVLPTIASFIGADTSGVLIAEEPHKQDENWLIIDVGTNAELVLGNRHGLVCTSTPTGPALEGAHIEYGMRAAPGAIERVEIDDATLEPRYRIIGEEEWGKGVAKGICGSAIIDVVAEMFRARIWMVVADLGAG